MKAFWNWLSGKKRIIALIYWSIVTPSLIIIWPEHIPSIVAKTSAIIGLILSALGLGHAAVKSYISGKTNSAIEEEMALALDKVEPNDQK